MPSQIFGSMLNDMRFTSSIIACCTSMVTVFRQPSSKSISGNSGNSTVFPSGNPCEKLMQAGFHIVAGLVRYPFPGNRMSMIGQQEILNFPGADCFDIALAPNLNGLVHEVGVRLNSFGLHLRPLFLFDPFVARFSNPRGLSLR
jgi:hypothetical protein